MIITSDFDPKRAPHFLNPRARKIFDEIIVELEHKGENLHECYALIVAAAHCVDRAERTAAAYEQGLATVQRRANAIALAAGALARLEISRRLPSPAANDRGAK